MGKGQGGYKTLPLFGVTGGSQERVELVSRATGNWMLFCNGLTGLSLAQTPGQLQVEGWRKGPRHVCLSLSPTQRHPPAHSSAQPLSTVFPPDLARLTVGGLNAEKAGVGLVS